MRYSIDAIGTNITFRLFSSYKYTAFFSNLTILLMISPKIFRQEGVTRITF